MKKSIFLFILSIASLNCKGQTNKNMEFSETEKDSISNIIKELYGNWISENNEILDLYKNGVYNCHMTIEKCLILREINDESEDTFENRICIEEIIPISETSINSPKPDFVRINLLIKKHYLPDSFGIFITKKDNKYGFLYPTEMESTFVGIKFLNEDYLILTDGKTYKKIK